MTAMAQEPSGFRCGWFSHPFTLLIPAFALRAAPLVLPLQLLCRHERSPTITPNGIIRGFGGMLEPRHIVGAGALDQ